MVLTQTHSESRKMDKPSAVQAREVVRTEKHFRWVARMNARSAPLKPKNFATQVCWLC